MRIVFAHDKFKMLQDIEGTSSGPLGHRSKFRGEVPAADVNGVNSLLITVAVAQE